jgi:AmmeMemoRadiSam system protein A
LPGSAGWRIILDVTAPESAGDVRTAALALARETVERYVRTGSVADPPFGPSVEPPAGLGEPSGAFVTLRLGGRLRGCVGTLASTRSDVAREIVAAAVAAASADPRFSPVRPDELAALDYEVDIVGAVEPVEGLEDLDPGRYGVLVEADGRRGVLLPDLAGVETAARQVDIAREKAGLAPGVAMRLSRFTVRRYRETP